MKKIISFMHVSLDGFVAGPKGEMNWIRVNEELFAHIGKRIASTDTALYGRVTFEMMEGYWPTAADKPDASRHDIEHAAWYNRSKKIVLSATLKSGDFTNTTVIGDNLKDNLQKIKGSPDGGSKEILLFGSPTATHALIQENLIDGYWLFLNPVILGNGIPLFSGIKEKISLELLSARSFSCGVTELDYRTAG